MLRNPCFWNSLEFPVDTSYCKRCDLISLHNVQFETALSLFSTPDIWPSSTVDLKNHEAYLFSSTMQRRKIIYWILAPYEFCSIIGNGKYVQVWKNDIWENPYFIRKLYHAGFSGFLDSIQIWTYLARKSLKIQNWPHKSKNIRN